MKDLTNHSFLISGFTVLVFLFLLSSCSCNQDYTPRPKGYFRIELPEKKYSRYTDPLCPYSFDLPSYATVTPYHDSVAQPCWKYIRFGRFNGEIFFSYKQSKENISRFMEESRDLAYKHTVKADVIDESVFSIPGKSYGMVYDIGGQAASPLQFFITDSIQHFIRGALYFNVPPQPDSLEPVINFIREDVIQLMQSLEWGTSGYGEKKK
jgi:gliding motility-associated lipoprotein GldD